ncbi:hypothetical protein HMPREF2580_04030 [Staphylococcus sp. HMSC036D05]|uniref:DUF4238 domain-containing protein n=1 Tax=Staphylococcus sp. HMSC036D05 TaxID=1715059 RepID=UPI0008A9CA7D|nr:DUF4238 domain-containing protein [Staphylococcus sp. HMSC036D05]OHO72678.1 hypothetical protein HMPREF2580_04030 [Staphylococcus sp. HMSC036D05]
MVTRKQHYYPRGLLKHFANEQNKVYVYIPQSNKISTMDYANVCVKKDTYESNDKVDNILENILGNYESQVCSIVEIILKNTDVYELSITVSQQQILYRYMWLQFLRTDAGRIHFMSLYENIFSYKNRTQPIELEEIKNNKNQERINNFNYVFKQTKVLEKFLKAIEIPDNMFFHIARSRTDLITSDNPVIITDNGKQLLLPISQNLCIEFQDASANYSNNLIVELFPQKARYLKEATINTANYCVIANNPVDIKLNNYIYKRFRKENWKIGAPHIPKV